MSTEDQAHVYRTFCYRVKDARAARRLRALGNAVNTVWNYCNEVSKRSAERGPNWITSRQLQDLTRGASRDLAISSQTVQAVCQEFVARRRAHGKPKLRWRRSRGAERSLGWVPFKNQTFKLDGKVAVYAGQCFQLWLHRPIHGRIKVLPRHRRYRRRGLCRQYLAPVADRVGEGQSHARRVLVDAAQPCPIQMRSRRGCLRRGEREPHNPSLFRVRKPRRRKRSRRSWGQAMGLQRMWYGP